MKFFKINHSQSLSVLQYVERKRYPKAIKVLMAIYNKVAFKFQVAIR